MYKNRYDNGKCCPPPPPHQCNRLGPDNGINIEVDIKSVNNVRMEDLFFLLRFRIYGSPDELVFHKEQLYSANGKFYALVNEKYFHEGWLMCDIEIFEPMPGWPGGMKPALVKCNTNIVIGNCFDIPYPMECGIMPNSKGYVNGYKVKFKKVDNLPEEGEDDDDLSNPDGIVLYGKVSGLTSFRNLNSSHLAGLARLDRIPLNGLTIDGIKVGETVVVLTQGEHVQKCDGGCGRMPFSTAVMGANGEVITINGENYKVFGETMLVSGSMEVFFE